MPVPEGQTGLRPYVDGAGHDIRLAGTRPVGPRLPSGRPYDLTVLQDLEVHLSQSWAATPHPTPARGGLYSRRRPHPHGKSEFSKAFFSRPSAPQSIGRSGVLLPLASLRVFQHP